MHDLGKGRTPRSSGRATSATRKPARGWSERSANDCGCRPTTASSRCSPRAGTDIAHRAEELRPRTILELLESCDAFRRPERFRELLLACEADYRGRGGLPRPALSAGGTPARGAGKAAAAVTLTDADRAGLPGEKIGELLRRRRLAALKAAA